MHVGLIPDGNRRWATERRASLQHAYAIGFSNGIDLTMYLSEMGVRHISLFGLSWDNYKKRPAEQLDPVISQITDSMSVARHLLLARGVRVRFIGDLDSLADQHRRQLNEIQAAVSTIEHPNAEMNILVNYDLRWDFDMRLGQYATHNIPDCDLVFRSGGKKRLSGFLPKQSANAELFFTSKLWPDVRKSDLASVMENYRKIVRNFGA